MKLHSLRKIALISASVMAISSTCLAGSDYYHNSNYDDEGDLVFKFSGSYVSSESKVDAEPKKGKEKPSSIIDFGYGVNASLGYFFTDHIATELSVGGHFFRVKSKQLHNASIAYGLGGTPEKKNEMYFVPVGASLQYHIAPFGGIRPYIGVGGHASYIFTRAKALRAEPGYGLLMQAGVDFVAMDDTFINLDVKQYLLKTKVTFRKEFLNEPLDLKTKMKWNPLVVSIGLGFKF